MGVGSLPRLLRRPGSLILVALAGVCLLPGSRPAAAQTTDLYQLEAEYRSARADLESAIAARDAVQRAYERALDAVNAAASEGEGALQSAMRTFLRQSDELDRLDRRVDERFEALQEAHDAYLDALDARREQMEDALADARTAQEERDIQVRLRDLIRQYENLEEERGAFQVDLIFLPQLEIDPRDTPTDVELKLDILRRKVREADELLESIDEEIERLEARLREERRRENFTASLGRFEDTNPPVVGSGSDRVGRDNEAPPDSTVVGRELPLPERIEKLRNDRRQLQARRDQTAARVEQFQDYLRRITE